MARLIIFVDGYPFSKIHYLEKLKNFESFHALSPSYGYSVNLHHEMFQGKGADTLGFFGDMARVSSTVSSSKMMKYLDICRIKFPFISRVIYKLLSLLFKFDYAFLPPSISCNFSRVGEYLLQIHKNISIGGEKYRIHCFDKKLKFGERDKEVFKSAFISTKTDNFIIAAFTEMDWVLHKFGFGSIEFEDKINQVFLYVDELAESFLELNPSGEIILVSDHGMVPCSSGVNFKLEEKFGLPFSDGVSYFYDSLYLHLWNDGNDSLYNEIIEWLSLRKEGSFIKGENRELYNICSNKFGDDIFLLHPGFAFAPNYFGYGLLKAYHGYAPEVVSGYGVFCSNKKTLNSTHVYSSSEFYNYLRENKNI